MSQEIFFLKNGMAHECFILSRTVKTLYVRAAPVQRAGQASLLFYCPSLGGFPWWTEGPERWEDRSGRCLIKREQSGVQRTSLSQVKWDLNWEERWAETAKSSLGMTFAWHFNCLLLPENSFVQRWRKTALVLTWDAKWWMGPSKRMKCRETLSNGWALIRADQGLDLTCLELGIGNRETVFAL